MTAPEIIHQLVERFERNLDAYRKGSYNEAQVRQEFINPMFKALGWDMDNEKGYAEAYKDVIHEDAIKVGGKTKAPDYCFRIGGSRKFFLEAKKPAIDIKEAISPAFQLRRYAWSAKLPLSVLTDFEEFAVYDCRVRPVAKDKPSTSRTLYFNFMEYPDRWEEIRSIFHREEVLKGSFDKYVESSAKKRGTAQVDDAFLAEIEGWRDKLAKNIALRNPDLSQRELNFAVQRTIDRIIFLRICEDRGIEDYGRLRKVLKDGEIYSQLLQLFRKADDRYNSGLFHFQKEKGRPGDPDQLTPEIIVDDKPLKEIINHLYYPDCPYEFSVLGADILGHVYEQFLGKVIRLTKSHQAKVDEKPEVRKAGGVYYTPTYIVDYIVKNTVGKLVEDKKPGPKGGVSNLKILDPACGSGSFLLGAYQYLLDWHLEEYIKDLKRWGAGKNPAIYQDQKGEWKLTTDERKRILLNNIYGVDIDPQAVEVTKLSLLLKVLEGVSSDILKQQLTLYRERALPDLGNNIKCGNSLIGPDFYDGKQVNLFDEEESYSVNVFNWEEEFSNIFKTGGFNIVIGNPPYIGFHGFKSTKGYLINHFVSAKGKFDYYLPFVEKGISLLTLDGLLSYICPTNFTKRDHGRFLRSHLLENTRIIQICDFADKQVFSGALNYTGIFIFRKSQSDKTHKILYKKGSLKEDGFFVKQSKLSDNSWVFRTDTENLVIDKITQGKCVPLEKIANSIAEGIVTGQNSVFLVPQKICKENKLESELLKPCIRGREIRRYYIKETKEFLIYPYHLEGKKTKVLLENDFKKIENIWAYLTNKKSDLSGRTYFDKSSKAWYELWCQRDMHQLQRQKIVVAELADSNRFSIANEKQYYGDTVCGITLHPKTKESLFYILGLLNSRMMEFYYKKTTVPKANNFYIYKTMYLKKIPIRLIDFSNSSENGQHDKLVKLVKKMLDLQIRINNSKTNHQKSIIQRQIDTLDDQIDQLVYQLYGLNEEEIKIVENEIP